MFKVCAVTPFGDSAFLLCPRVTCRTFSHVSLQLTLVLELFSDAEFFCVIVTVHAQDRSDLEVRSLDDTNNQTSTVRQHSC